MGMVVLRMTHPAVSIPILRERGATSRRRSQMCRQRGWRLGLRHPYTTASSRLMLLLGSLPMKKSEKKFDDTRIRVELLTKPMSWTFDLWILESQRTFSTGPGVLRTISWQRLQSSSKRALVREVNSMHSKRGSISADVGTLSTFALASSTGDDEQHEGLRRDLRSK